MLTEDEVKGEIELIKEKIKTFEKEIEPFVKLQQEIETKFDRLHSPFSFNINIPIKSGKEAMIKSWKKELLIYERILKGKRMDHLQDRTINDVQSEHAKKLMEKLKE